LADARRLGQAQALGDEHAEQEGDKGGDVAQRLMPLRGGGKDA
jgi:hypothetical protein